MNFSSKIHGNCEFELDFCSEGIIIIRNSGSWNLQAAEMYVDEFLTLAVNTFSGRPWGCLNDYRNWQLCTPDVSDYFNQSMSRLLELKLTHQAVLTNNAVSKMVIDRYADMAPSNEFITSYFNEEEDALNWLRAQLKQYE